MRERERERGRLTCGSNKGKQEVKAEEGEVGSGLGLGNEVQESDVWKQGKREELGCDALGVNGRCPWINWQWQPAHDPSSFSASV